MYIILLFFGCTPLHTQKIQKVEMPMHCIKCKGIIWCNKCNLNIHACICAYIPAFKRIRAHAASVNIEEAPFLIGAYFQSIL